MTATLRAGIVALVVLCALPVSAHEVRPAYLRASQSADGTFDVFWKQPVLGDRRLPLEPRFPDDCTRGNATAPEFTGNALLETWTLSCDLRAGEVAIDGLSATLTDVMLQVDYADGSSITQLLRPEAASLDLADPTPSVWGYLRLGIEHLVFGIDHVLFVIGLTLYIRGFVPLLKTITAFTVAHSITLAASVLDLVYLPQGPVEAVIALSILFLARELVVPEARRSRFTNAKPWWMAIAFGLLHGFGFAGALADIGLPREQLAGALLLFNIGIELGQLLVIGAVLALLYLVTRLVARPVAAHAFALLMGVVAAYWTIDRIAAVV